MSATLELETVYDRHAPALYGFLLNLTRSKADAHDLLQAVFCKLAARRRLLDGLRDQRAFLLRLAHNQAIDLARRRQTRARHVDQFAAEAVSPFAPTADPDEAALRDGLAAALGELPADQRAVIHLKLWEELTFDAIAETLGVSPNTAASRYRYGLDKLRQRLRPLYEEIR